MTSSQLRLAQLEELLRRIDEEVDLTGFELQDFIAKLIKETPEESLLVYDRYLASLKMPSKRISLLRETKHEC